MTLFEQYAKKKELKQFLDEVEKHAEGYAKINVLAEVGGFPIHHLVINPKGGRTLCFIAGIHGDEPGGPYGVLEFLKQGMRIPKDIRLEIVPLANPTGFMNKTRANSDSFDINRGFYESELIAECEALWKVAGRKDIECLHTLHEDPDSRSFYVYYTHHRRLAEGMRDDVAKRFFPIHDKPEVYGDKSYEGLVPPPHTKRNTVEDRALEENMVPYITTETPGRALLKSRAKCNRDIMKYVIHSFGEM